MGGNEMKQYIFMKEQNSEWKKALNLGVMTPLGIKWPFLRGHLRPLENILWFITRSKLQLWSSRKNNFVIEGQHNIRN